MPEPRPATTPEEPPQARPSAARGDEVPLLSNAELARIFHQIGDLVELKGELIFKAQAYHRAADAISDSPVEVARAYREGHAPRLPGVGRAGRRSGRPPAPGDCVGCGAWVRRRRSASWPVWPASRGAHGGCAWARQPRPSAGGRAPPPGGRGGRRAAPP